MIMIDDTREDVRLRIGAYFFESQVSDRLSSVANQAPRG